jgi:hypothetical protein
MFLFGKSRLIASSKSPTIILSAFALIAREGDFFYLSGFSCEKANII